MVRARASTSTIPTSRVLDRVVAGPSAILHSGVILTNPAGHLGWYCNNLPATLFRGQDGIQCPWVSSIHATSGLASNRDNYQPIGDGDLVDVGYWHVPGMQPQNWNEGVRFHTLLGGD